MLKNWHLVFCPTCQQLNWHWNIVLQCWLCSKCWCVIVWKISHDYLALYSRHFTIFTYQPQFLSHYFVYIFLFSIMSFLPSQFLCGSGYHYLPWVKQLASSPLIFFFFKGFLKFSPLHHEYSGPCLTSHSFWNSNTCYTYITHTGT